MGLSSEQMAGVLSVIADELAPLEKIRASAAQRQARLRNGVVSRDSDDTVSRDNNVTPYRDSNVTPRALENIIPSQTVDNREVIPPIPPKPQNPEPSVTRETPAEYPDGFEDFWEAYPPRAGGRDKIAAVRAYRAALKRASSGQIITGARAYRAYVTAAGKLRTEYIKQARTWLNGNGWTEDYDHAEHRSETAGHHTRSNLAIITGTG